MFVNTFGVLLIFKKFREEDLTWDTKSFESKFNSLHFSLQIFLLTVSPVAVSTTQTLAQKVSLPGHLFFCGIRGQAPQLIKKIPAIPNG